jgi:hypothetical protein
MELTAAGGRTGQGQPCGAGSIGRTITRLLEQGRSLRQIAAYLDKERRYMPRWRYYPPSQLQIVLDFRICGQDHAITETVTPGRAANGNSLGSPLPPACASPVRLQFALWRQRSESSSAWPAWRQAGLPSACVLARAHRGVAARRVARSNSSLLAHLAGQPAPHRGSRPRGTTLVRG